MLSLGVLTGVAEWFVLVTRSEVDIGAEVVVDLELEVDLAANRVLLSAILLGTSRRRRTHRNWFGLHCRR